MQLWDNTAKLTFTELSSFRDLKGGEEFIDIDSSGIQKYFELKKKLLWDLGNIVLLFHFRYISFYNYFI